MEFTIIAKKYPHTYYDHHYYYIIRLLGERQTELCTIAVHTIDARKPLDGCTISRFGIRMAHWNIV